MRPRTSQATTPHHLKRLLQRRILRLFQRRGLLDLGTVEKMLTWQGSSAR